MAFYNAVVAACAFTAAAVVLLSNDLIDNSDCEACNYYADTEFCRTSCALF